MASEPEARENNGATRWADRETWPLVKVTFYLTPWNWEIRFYQDDIEPWYELTIGPVKFHASWNRPPFREPVTAPSGAYRTNEDSPESTTDGEN